MSFTPGPWVSFYKSKYDEYHVALPQPGTSMKLSLCPDGIQSNNREADARLIAAAPELLEALKDARDELWRAHQHTMSEDEFHSRYQAIDAAISKATAQRS